MQRGSIQIRGKEEGQAAPILLLGDSLSEPGGPGSLLFRALPTKQGRELTIDAKRGRAFVSAATDGGKILGTIGKLPKGGILLLMLGTNDANLSIAPSVRLESAFRQLVELTSRGRIKVLAIGPPSFVGQPKLDKGAAVYYEEAVKALGASRVLDTRPLTEDLDEERDRKGIHFTGKGAEVFARRLAKKVQAKLPELSPPGSKEPAKLDLPALALVGVTGYILYRWLR